MMRLVDCLEKADIPWCAIGGVAVNHWAKEPMVTQDVDFVVASDAIERAVSLLEQAGFQPERFDWSVNFKGHSAVSVQLSTAAFYRDLPPERLRPTFTAFSCEWPRWKTLCGAKSRRGAIRSEDKASGSRTLPMSPVSWNRILSFGIR